MVGVSLESAAISALIFVAGCFSRSILMPFIKYFVGRLIWPLSLSRRDGVDSSLYRLDHAVLNIEVPPDTMWMNMGYWTESDFPTACKALLDEVLKFADLLRQDGSASTFATPCRLKLIDLGFGCGDQTMYLTQLNKANRAVFNGINPGEKLDEKRFVSEPLFDSYVGVTIAQSQFIFAKERIYSQEKSGTADVQLFCADAARPQSWCNDLNNATKSRIYRDRDGSDRDAMPEQVSWVLALDSLYHFSPSRKLIFCHAHEELEASIMAFDLLVTERPSLFNRILLHIVAKLMSIPFSNFLTVEEYKAQLAAAGYKSDKIKIRDISEHVFSAIALFIEKKDRELRPMGINLGPYRAAGKIFKWWASSGIVRGCIIVAEK